MKRLFLSVAILTVVAGCAVTEPATEPAKAPMAIPSGSEAAVSAPAAETPPVVEPPPSTAEPPRPRHNLSGFPLPYRQGYDDGCNSVQGKERKDAQRFARDANYRTGWQDGYALCAPKK